MVGRLEENQRGASQALSQTGSARVARWAGRVASAGLHYRLGNHKN